MNRDRLAAPNSNSKGLKAFVSDHATRFRLGMFAALFLAMQLFALSDFASFAGQLGAAPILPLFALYFMGNDSSVLRTALASVLIGPVIACGFVIWFAVVVNASSYLSGVSWLPSRALLC